MRTKPVPAPPREPLSFEEILSTLDQFRDLGVLYLTLTGGEPLLHPRFWDIAEEAKRRAFALRIFSNGIAINEAVADRFAKLGPFCIEISIHGAKEETAEALNLVPGSHRRLLHALALLKERQIRVFLKCAVTRLLENELEEIKAIADSFEFPVYFDPILTMSDDGEAYPLDLQASDDALRRLFSSTGMNLGNSPFERDDDQPNCGIAMSTLHVDPYGNISPCVQWKESVGNLRNEKIETIWNTSQEMERIRQMSMHINRQLKEQTPDHAFCAHCPGLSQLRYGDPAKPEEQYLRMARIRREVSEEDKEKAVR